MIARIRESREILREHPQIRFAQDYDSQGFQRHERAQTAIGSYPSDGIADDDSRRHFQAASPDVQLTDCFMRRVRSELDSGASGLPTRRRSSFSSQEA
jgi:hypothetical protein